MNVKCDKIYSVDILLHLSNCLLVKENHWFQTCSIIEKQVLSTRTEREKKHSSVQYEFLLGKKLEYFISCQGQTISYEVKQRSPDNMHWWTKNLSLAAIPRTIRRCLFMPDRCGNESFVLMLSIFSAIFSMNNIVQQCPSERKISFTILSITAGSCRQPQTYVKPEAAITVFELLMMRGVSLETCWAIKKHCNNKFYYTIASFWLFI